MYQLVNFARIGHHHPTVTCLSTDVNTHKSEAELLQLHYTPGNNHMQMLWNQVYVIM